jgi:hypothetical protein
MAFHLTAMSDRVMDDDEKRVKFWLFLLNARIARSVGPHSPKELAQ